MLFGWPFIIFPVSHQKREDDPRNFIGERYGDEFESLGAKTFSQPIDRPSGARRCYARYREIELRRRRFDMIGFSPCRRREFAA